MTNYIENKVSWICDQNNHSKSPYWVSDTHLSTGYTVQYDNHRWLFNIKINIKYN